MRVSINKNTGRIIESQSGDDAGLDVLMENAQASGIDSADVSVSVMPDADFYAMLAAQDETDKDYAEKRREAYPSIGDQLDALYKAGIFPSELADKIAQIKNKYPKESK